MRVAAVFLLAAALPAAEDETRASLSLTEEVSVPAGALVRLPRATTLLLIEPALSWRHGERWRAAASLAGIGLTQSETHARLRVKEAWAGLTLGDFDFTAGKRILRWGTGYAFTPTGILDPPRNPADPTDRLNLNEGREMVAADWIKGRHAVTAAQARGGVTALRYNALVAGFDSAVVLARTRGQGAFYGFNFTRVFGEALEIHGELARHASTAVLLGAKYTLRSGLGAIVEWYAPAPGRPRYLFARLGKSRLRELPGWKQWDLGAALLANAGDRSRILIFDVTRRLGDNFSVLARGELPGGRKWQSEYGMIPYSALLSIGLRCQL